MVVATDDVIALHRDLRCSLDSVVPDMRRLEREAMMSPKRTPRLSNEWFADPRGQIADLDEIFGKRADIGDRSETL
ncbi:hypothetical protein [Roseovarius sp.]|uniref:hypothetical protein n=1 Tax=Roseovarius sp. TaxID=1486281 RepID=UPI003B5AF581